MSPQKYGDRWEIVDNLGEGGQAHSYIARDINTGDDGWALKRLKNPNRLGRFRQEIDTLQKLHSSLIPEVEDYSLDEPAYVVYRHIPGTTLEAYVQSENPTFDEVFDLFRDVVDSVVQAHAHNIVHRDIKPNNVIVDDSEPRHRAHLIDFGICQFDEDGLFLTSVDEALGNRSFAAPEFELGSDIASGPLSDVYGLGKLLFWSVTGGRMFPREAFEQQMERVPQPRGIERAYVKRLLQKSVHALPANRATAEEFLRLCERYGLLMREGVTAVGSKDQLCSVCRQGNLEWLRDFSGFGFPISLNDIESSDTKILQCTYCGYVQLHRVQGTTSQLEDLWEI